MNQILKWFCHEIQNLFFGISFFGGYLAVIDYEIREKTGHLVEKGWFFSLVDSEFMQTGVPISKILKDRHALKFQTA